MQRPLVNSRLRIDTLGSAHLFGNNFHQTLIEKEWKFMNDCGVFQFLKVMSHDAIFLILKNFVLVKTFEKSIKRTRYCRDIFLVVGLM